MTDILQFLLTAAQRIPQLLSPGVFRTLHDFFGVESTSMWQQFRFLPVAVVSSALLGSSAFVGATLSSTQAQQVVDCVGTEFDVVVSLLQSSDPLAVSQSVEEKLMASSSSNNNNTSPDPKRRRVEKPASADDTQLRKVLFIIGGGALKREEERDSLIVLLETIVATCQVPAVPFSILAAAIVLVDDIWNASHFCRAVQSNMARSVVIRQIDKAPSDEVVAAFLYEVIPAFPVILPADGVDLLHSAWAGSNQLLDVCYMFHSMLCPFENYRRACPAVPGEVQSFLSFAPPMFCDANERFIEKFLAVSSRAALRITAADNPYTKEAVCFAALYEALCRKQWELLMKLDSVQSECEATEASLEPRSAPEPTMSSLVEGSRDSILVLSLSHMRRPNDGSPPSIDVERFPPIVCPLVPLPCEAILDLLESPAPLSKPGAEPAVAAEQVPCAVHQRRFYDATVSDAMRVCYILRKHAQLRRGGSSNMSFDALQRQCGGISSKRFLRALSELKQSNLATINFSKETVRCT